MKNLKFLMLALFAVLGLSSCEKQDWIDVDYSEALVGTWTYFAENGQAEAMVINPDGSFAITGIMQDGHLYEEKGTIKVVNNKVSLVYEGDTEAIEGRLELVAGKSLSIVLFEEYDIRLTYDYCKEDLSEEIIGMWVCNEGVAGMSIQTYRENGKCIFTGFTSDTNGYLTNFESTYEVLGDMMFQKTGDRYFATRLTYSPNGNALGDILTTTSTILVNGKSVTSSYSFLRIKQSLDLKGKVYDYNSAYVTNAKGADEDFNITGSTFNLANIKAGNFDMMFRSVLFCVEFPNTGTIKQNFLTNGISTGFETPITVDGNKVTLDLSAANPAYRKVDMYMFQDADASQLHIYMPTSSFINYFANLEIVTLLTEGKIDPTDTAAVEKVYTNMEARVESINVSFVFKSRK